MLALAALLLAAPVPAEKVKPPEVRFVGTVERGKYVYLKFEVFNPNAANLPYAGYTPNSFDGGREAGVIAPLYRVELRTGNDWKARGEGWCKTGVGPVAIPAKGKATFEAPAPAGEWDEARFGFVWYTGPDRKTPEVAWGTVTRKDANPK